VIAFVGSVFSPYYAWSGRGDPANHCAINVALYGRQNHRWAMTEHGRSHVQRSAEAFGVGASAMAWRGDALVIDIHETAAPIPMPVRGQIVVEPHAAPGRAIALDQAGRHLWAPIAPRCSVRLAFTQPGFSWRGEGYFDSNRGSEPLETGFRHWDWARAHDGSGCAVTYRGAPRQGEALDLALHIDDRGEISARDLPPLQAMRSSVWGIERRTRADAARVMRTFEDAPFYARSELDATLYGHRGPALHESLDLDRFASAWVRALLPVRMPRRG
jgi:carotenoid 1,2-hydratase